jgi:hypothetical protein
MSAMMSTVRNTLSPSMALKLIEEKSHALVRDAALHDRHLGETVHGAIAGAIAVGGESNVNVAQAAEAAALGAIEAVADLDEWALERIKDVVTGTILGVQPLDENTFLKGRRSP